MQLSLRSCAVGSALVILTMAISGCERAPAPIELARSAHLASDPARLSLTAGASGRLAAQASDAVGKPIDGARFHFAPSDPRMLRVTALGKVTSLGPAGLTSILITSGSKSLTVPVEVWAGPAKRFEVVGAGQLAMVAGSILKEPVSARLVDAFDNPVANSRVVFEAHINPSISISTDTDMNGVATVTLPAITHAGHFILNVHTSGVAPVSLPLELHVSAAAPAALEAVNVPASGPVALFPEFDLVLQVRDAFGNPVPNVMVRWRIDSGSASFDPRQSVSSPDGLVRTHWQLTGLKRRGTTLRAFVARNEKVDFERWIALER